MSAACPQSLCLLIIYCCGGDKTAIQQQTEIEIDRQTYRHTDIQNIIKFCVVINTSMQKQAETDRQGHRQRQTDRDTQAEYY